MAVQDRRRSPARFGFHWQYFFRHQFPWAGKSAHCTSRCHQTCHLLKSEKEREAGREADGQTAAEPVPETETDGQRGRRERERERDWEAERPKDAETDTETEKERQTGHAFHCAHTRARCRDTIARHACLIPRCDLTAQVWLDIF